MSRKGLFANVSQVSCYIAMLATMALAWLLAFLCVLGAYQHWNWIAHAVYHSAVAWMESSLDVLAQLEAYRLGRIRR